MIRNYTAIDIEATGLNPKTEKIIEVGAVKVREGKIAEEYTSLINPGRRLEERITELTGITDEMLQKAPLPEQVIPELLTFVGDDILLGHNLMFDYSFMKRAAVNLKLTDEKKKAEGIDTLKLARRFLADLESRSLPYLCRYFGIPQKAHRAVEDARAAALLYEKLAAVFYEESEFAPRQLVYRVKRETPATAGQKERLYNLVLKHKLVLGYDIDKLTKNEASRITDKIISRYGRI